MMRRMLAAMANHADLRRMHVGGFNLLPYRQRDARLARRRLALEALAAVLAGCMAVLVLAGWQMAERSQLDAQRKTVERSLAQLSKPLAEHARIVRDGVELRARAAHSLLLSEPLTHLLDLLDALGNQSDDGVRVRQLHFGERDTELLATSRGHAALAEWTEQIGAVEGVKGIDVSDVHLASFDEHRAVPLPDEAALTFAAKLRWTDQIALTRKAASHASQDSVKSRGER